MRTPGSLDYYRGPDGRRFLLLQAFLLATGAIALSVIFANSDVDRLVSRWFFDAEKHAFPLVNHWLLKNVLHDAARTTSVVATLVLIGATAAAWLALGAAWLRDCRHELLFVCVAAVAAAAVVGALKHLSGHACPWDLTDFGGSNAYRHLFTAPTSMAVVDGCFPAAHPVTAYAWSCVGFVLYPIAQRAARCWWSAVLFLGTLLGWVQIARGAHFLSHVLWSAWVVWSVNVALLALMRFSRRAR